MKWLRVCAILMGIGVLTAVGVLEGCSSAPTHSVTAFRKRLTIWIGKDINALISAWGPPTDIYPLPNGKSKLYIWNESGGQQIVHSNESSETGGAYANRVYGSAYGNRAEAGSAVARNLTCKRIMTVSDSGIVTSASLDGNNCVAPVE